MTASPRRRELRTRRPRSSSPGLRRPHSPSRSSGRSRETSPRGVAVAGPVHGPGTPQGPAKLTTSRPSGNSSTRRPEPAASVGIGLPALMLATSAGSIGGMRPSNRKRSNTNGSPSDAIAEASNTWSCCHDFFEPSYCYPTHRIATAIPANNARNLRRAQHSYLFTFADRIVHGVSQARRRRRGIKIISGPNCERVDAAASSAYLISNEEICER